MPYRCSRAALAPLRAHLQHEGGASSEAQPAARTRQVPGRAGAGGRPGQRTRQGGAGARTLVALSQLAVSGVRFALSLSLSLSLLCLSLLARCALPLTAAPCAWLAQAHIENKLALDWTADDLASGASRNASLKVH